MAAASEPFSKLEFARTVGIHGPYLEIASEYYFPVNRRFRRRRSFAKARRGKPNQPKGQKAYQSTNGPRRGHRYITVHKSNANGAIIGTLGLERHRGTREGANPLNWYVRQGFRVVSQTESSAQLVKPKVFSFVWALLWFLLLGVGLVVYLLYYAAKKDKTVYLTSAGGCVSAH